MPQKQEDTNENVLPKNTRILQFINSTLYEFTMATFPQNSCSMQPIKSLL